MKLIRVFPRRTNATPVDDLVRIGEPPGFFDEADEVHISVTFTRDIPAAERLEKQWRDVAPTKIGGPAYKDPGGVFVPGKYLANGYVFTSRGCPGNCWFCDVWKREGQTVRELPICDGHNILDSNILATSDRHFQAVIGMLKRQKKRAEFTGGLEAARLTRERAKMLFDIKPESLFFAYDTPEDRDPLWEAGKILKSVGFERCENGRPSRPLRCYVLVGHKKDTIEDATRRLEETLEAGFLPTSMYYQPPGNRKKKDPKWAALHKEWSRPPSIVRRYKTETESDQLSL